MRSMKVMLALASALSLAACGSDPVTVGAPTPTPAPPGPDAPPPMAEEAPDEEAAAAAALADAGIGLPSYRDEDFVEAETNRDPFRSYAQFFVQRPAEGRVQREVIMGDTGVEELQLIAVVTGIADARAMFLDRGGRGHTVHRGDFIGRPEVVQIGGPEGTQATLNWRVDRIRCARTETGDSTCEVILTREDPSAPNRPPLTRVVPLHDAAQAG